MKIIAHRGIWYKREDGNTLSGFERAFSLGFGIETDIRDYKGQLVVSHNIADEESFLFSRVLEVYKKVNCEQPLAINIKADGIQQLLANDLNKFEINNYFVFDMSIPEQVVYAREGFNFYTRMSEYETMPVMLDSAKGIWMDEWQDSWINRDIISEFLDRGKTIAIISPEIHGRDRSLMWQYLKVFSSDNRVALCTDVAEEARRYFYAD